MCAVRASSRSEPQAASAVHSARSAARGAAGSPAPPAVAGRGRMRPGRAQRRQRREEHEGEVAHRPADRLPAPGNRRLDEDGVAEQRRQRREVREREQPVRRRGARAPGQPRLEQRARARQQDIREPDGHREHAQDAERRIAVRARARAGPEEAPAARARLSASAPTWATDCSRAREPAVERVGVEVAGEERGLEEDEARDPHRRRPAEPRQEPLGDDRLDPEEEERARARSPTRRRARPRAPPREPSRGSGLRSRDARCVGQGFGAPAPCERLQERREEIDRHREERRGVPLGGDLAHRLEVPELDGDRRPRQDLAASASFSAAWNSPSALMTLARRSRSASACLDIARCMSCGRSTCFTSTAVTFTPQGSVCWSMIRWQLLVDLVARGRGGRPARPGRARSAAWSARSARSRRGSPPPGRPPGRGSMTRKKITAFTLIETLSRVITSCGGTSMATVRRLTFTILSTNGTSRTRPGPLPSPGLKIALAPAEPEDRRARSYSRRIFTDDDEDEEPEDQDRHDVEGGFHALLLAASGRLARTRAPHEA